MKIVLTPHDVQKIIESWAKRVGYDVSSVTPQEDSSYVVDTNSIDLAKPQKPATQKKYPTQED